MAHAGHALARAGSGKLDAAASRACAVMGTLEWVVESRQGDEQQTWYVVSPDPALAQRYREAGVRLAPGCRVVVDAVSLRPLGLLGRDTGESPPAACGYNPYFDVKPC